MNPPMSTETVLRYALGRAETALEAVYRECCEGAAPEIQKKLRSVPPATLVKLAKQSIASLEEDLTRRTAELDRAKAALGTLKTLALALQRSFKGELPGMILGIIKDAGLE